MPQTPALRAEDLPVAFGRYRVEKLLGQGGMGVVYLAHDTQLDRPVALKIPHLNGNAGPEVLQRFQREARAAATIRHPNVCPLHDVGEIDGVPYLTMSFIEGQSLAAVVAVTPLDPRSSAVLVHKLALALAEAHKSGVIHRDLKPGNIMIDQRGEPLIMDFGLARRHRRGDVRLTQLGTRMGTPAYMPPEQANGEVGAMGPVSDVYSLGVILYELLAGRRPFTGGASVVVAKVLSGEPPPPPSRFRPNIDAQLEAICLKAMAKKPTDRYGSMTALAVALFDYLRGPTAAAEPEPELEVVDFRDSNQDGGSTPVPLAAQTATSRWVITLLLGVLVLSGVCGVMVLALTVILSLLRKAPEPPFAVATVPALASDFGTIQIEASEPAADLELKVNGQSGPIWGQPLRLPVGEHLLEVTGNGYRPVRDRFTVQPGDNPPRLVVLVKSARPPDLEPELIGPPVASVGTIQIQPSEPAADLELKVDGVGGRAWGDALRLTAGEHKLEVSRKGTVLASETIVVQPGANPAYRVVLAKLDPPPVAPPEPAKLLMCWRNGDNYDLYVMNDDGSDRVRLVTVPVKIANKNRPPTPPNPAWSPDGKQLAFLSTGDGGVPHLCVWNLESRKVKQLTSGNDFPDFSPAWGVDGKLAFHTRPAVAADGFGMIFVMDADGANRSRLSPEGAKDHGAAWSPDGKQIVFVSQRDGHKGFRIYVMDADGKNVKALTHTDNLVGNLLPAWSPDGKKIAYVECGDKENGEVVVIDRDGMNRKQLTTLGGSNQAPAWKPDGKQIAFIHDNKSLYLVNADGSGAPKEILTADTQMGRPAWKPGKPE